MANPFDPYRDALVVEHSTVWPEELAGAPADRSARESMEKTLHQSPDKAMELEYVRLATGFHRKITVTGDDLKRVAG
jgi:hypothetical protein